MDEKAVLGRKGIKAAIIKLAAEYENEAFLKEDPSQFMHRYTSIVDQEVVALLSTCLAFGKRTEILRHIELFLALMGKASPAQWIRCGGYKVCLPDLDRSFYRIFSYRQLRLFCESLEQILNRYDTLGQCIEADCRQKGIDLTAGGVAPLLSAHFPAECSPLVPRTEGSASKRLNLFLRWMARTHSPVDLGIWTWLSPAQLLMPMDTHVLSVAKEFGLLPAQATANLKYTLLLTEKMRRIFPKDPLKGDFALFGQGIDSVKNEK